MRGKVTTVAAIMPAYQVNTILILRIANNPLNKPLSPKIRSKINPTTVGGKISGEIKILSIKDFPLP